MSQAYTTPLVIRAADRDQVISVGAQDTAWHRETPTGLQGFPTWQTRYEGCLALIERLKTAGVQPPPRLALEFEDYAALPITADSACDPRLASSLLHACICGLSWSNSNALVLGPRGLAPGARITPGIFGSGLRRRT